jgi:hypothetical protein
MDVSKLLWSVVAFLSLDPYNSAVAQQINVPQLGVTGQVGQGTVGAPNVAVLGNLPQATSQTSAAGSGLLRPQTGLTEVDPDRETAGAAC